MRVMTCPSPSPYSTFGEDERNRQTRYHEVGYAEYMDSHQETKPPLFSPVAIPYLKIGWTAGGWALGSPVGRHYLEILGSCGRDALAI